MLEKPLIHLRHCRFIRVFLVASLVAACSFCSRADNITTNHEWIAGSLTPADSPTTQAAIYFSHLVEKETEGRVRIRHYDSSTLGTGQQQIEALALGTQQVYVGSGSAPSILLPTYGVIDLAFIFRNRQHFNAFLASSMMKELNQRLIDEFNIRVLAMNWFREPRYLLHRDHFIQGPQTLMGARARAPNLPMFLANWKNLGAVPVKVSFSEQYLALSQNLVEMTEASGDDIYPMRLHEVAPFITDAELMYPQVSVYVSEEAFRSLNSIDQAVISKAAFEAGNKHTELVTQRFTLDRSHIEQEGGQFQMLPPQAKNEFLKMVNQQVTRMEADGLIPLGWFDRIQTLQ